MKRGFSSIPSAKFGGTRFQPHETMRPSMFLEAIHKTPGAEVADSCDASREREVYATAGVSFSSSDIRRMLIPHRSERH
jgi:hypothetical protein